MILYNLAKNVPARWALIKLPVLLEGTAQLDWGGGVFKDSPLERNLYNLLYDFMIL
jgi:hypothetical protein